MTVTEYGGHTFDCLPSTDPKNANYPSRVAMPGLVPRKAKSWRGPYWRTDQGPIGGCVGFGWMVEAMSLPVYVRPTPNSVDGANRASLVVYHEAQLVDEFASTPPGEGSSVNAGAKVMRRRGYIKEWRWHDSVDDLIDGLLLPEDQDGGPQVMGTDWLDGMGRPDEHGIVKVTGSVRGRHCWTVRSYSPNYYGIEVLGARQTWGPGFARGGDFYVPVAGLRDLWKDGAESAMPIGRAAPIGGFI